LNVLYVWADSPNEFNCSKWNCIQPKNSIDKLEGHSADAIYINEFTKNTKEVQEKCMKADIIVVERNYFGDASVMVQFWKNRKKTVIGIFDDAYDIIHPKNISYDFWTQGKVQITSKEGEKKDAFLLIHPLKQFKWTLNMFKGVQVASEQLQKDWVKYNPNTYFVHNYLDMDKYLDVEPLFQKDDSEIVIGWCGSLSHLPSFEGSGAIRALEKIAKKYPNVKILIGGDKKIFDLINVDNKIFQKHVPAEQWESLLKSIDIGLAPLSGEYDKRRSWIKALEYMALKIPWIATNYPTYRELKEFGIMTENGYHNWEHALTEMIENYDNYKKLAENEAFEFALQQSSYEKVKEVTIPLYEKFIEMEYPIHTCGNVE
jgi:glycosyltransferase involved in cell wall biosynthesis